MHRCFFVSDLHGKRDRYAKLFERIAGERPQAVFLGGDLLPAAFDESWANGVDERSFIADLVAAGFRALRSALGPAYPHVFLILGNDDPGAHVPEILVGEEEGLWRHAHGQRLALGEFSVQGYACIPPTPFRLKDWERYDVSRFVDPGCVSPEEGARSVQVEANGVRFGTIQGDLAELADDEDQSNSIWLFHSPPYDTALDRAALDGQSIDHVPLDVHVGSIAIRRFIEERQPRVTLHGHVHESAQLTGRWRERLGETEILGAAHDGPELALVRFSPEDPGAATRELI